MYLWCRVWGRQGWYIPILMRGVEATEEGTQGLARAQGSLGLGFGGWAP